VNLHVQRQVKNSPPANGVHRIIIYLCDASQLEHLVKLIAIMIHFRNNNTSAAGLMYAKNKQEIMNDNDDDGARGCVHFFGAFIIQRRAEGNLIARITFLS
jgi:hypothetical protein